jgi:Leucine-rich repeat (LRR) protein
LSDNKLQTIEREAFSGLRSLKRLVLQNNGLKSLPVEALESVESLTSL